MFLLIIMRYEGDSLIETRIGLYCFWDSQIINQDKHKLWGDAALNTPGIYVCIFRIGLGSFVCPRHQKVVALGPPQAPADPGPGGVLAPEHRGGLVVARAFRATPDVSTEPPLRRAAPNLSSRASHNTATVAHERSCMHVAPAGPCANGTPSA